LRPDIIPLPTISALLRMYCQMEKEDNYIAYAKPGLLERQLKKHG